MIRRLLDAALLAAIVVAAAGVGWRLREHYEPRPVVIIDEAPAVTSPPALPVPPGAPPQK